MPRYQCTNCDHSFDHRRGRLRCPKCLRQNGLEELSDQLREHSQRSALKRLGLIAGLLLCATTLVVVVARMVSERNAGPPSGAVAQLDSAALARGLRARGVPQAELVDPFAPSAALRTLTGPIEAAEPASRAQAVARGLAPHLAGLPVDLMGGTGVDAAQARTAAELAHALQTKRAGSVLSYELAALLLSALRANSVVALLCEAFEQAAPVQAADPSGTLGRYAVAVYADSEKLAGPPLLVLDPARAADLPQWAGGGGDSAMTSVLKTPRPLDDVSAAARLYALRALQQIDRDAKHPERAYELAQWALDASSPSATLLAARAMVLVKAGGIEDATAQAQRAARQRSDPARRTVLAGLLLAQRNSQGAELELQQAIKQDETFWPAHRSLAALRWMAGDRSGGDLHLERAKALAPDEPSVVALIANQKLTRGETEAGLELLRDVARRQPNEQLLLQLYIALLQAQKQDEAATTRELLLKLTRDEEQMQELLERVAQSIGATDETAPTPQEGSAPAPGRGLTPEGFKLPDVNLGK